MEKWKQRSQNVKVEIYALLLAYRDPGTPCTPSFWPPALVAYAVSPIDLIPDFHTGPGNPG